MNDVTIKLRKLKFKAKYYNITEDKPYTRQQIKTLGDAAQLRIHNIVRVFYYRAFSLLIVMICVVTERNVVWDT